MKTIILIVGLLLFADPEDLLTGNWESKPSANGNVTEVIFRKDSSLDGFINKKLFTSGRYFFNPADSVISFVDNGCNNVTAVYKVQFFSNADSLRFTLLMDSCIDRRNGMQRLVLGRKK